MNHTDDVAEGNLYVDGINPWSGLPEGQPHGHTDDTDTAADTAEAYGRAMGATEATVRVEHVTYADGTRRVDPDAVVARWVARRERDLINRRVARVFHEAQEARWARAQIQDPAIRDALSLT